MISGIEYVCKNLPSRTNMYSKTAIFSALTKVYFANLDSLGREEIVKRWKTKVLGDAMVVQLGAIAVLQSTIPLLVDAIVAAMNKTFSKNLAINLKGESPSKSEA